MYEKYLAYLQLGRQKRGEKKSLGQYAIDLLKCIQQMNSIVLRAREAGESEDDIKMDLHILQQSVKLSANNVYYNAVIFSQLYKVRVKNGSHTLLSLSDLARQRNRKQSFVSYHDIGKNINHRVN